MDDGMQEGISVREAAVILGTTERAVRFRLQRKTLAGKRVDGKWWVYLDGTEGTATGNGTVATVETVAAPDWLQPLIDRTNGAGGNHRAARRAPCADRTRARRTGGSPAWHIP